MSAYADMLTYKEKRRIELDVRSAYPFAKVTKLRGMSFERTLHECKQFISYNTVIAEFMFSESVLHVALDWFDCSASTRTQFSKWLSTNDYPAYTAIKEQAVRYRKELDKMYCPEPTGEVYHDDESGCSYTFDF